MSDSGVVSGGLVEELHTPDAVLIYLSEYVVLYIYFLKSAENSVTL